MGVESDEDQYKLTDYHHVFRDESEWRCRVCGFTDSNKATVENCHPDARLNRERDTSVTASEAEHTGFVTPPYMDGSARNLLEEIRSAVRGSGETTVLRAAADVLARRLPDPENGTSAFQLFTHLVWLQQYQELPGYPIRTNANSTDTVTIRQFCHSASEFEGNVTDALIRESELVERKRIYRAKVLCVTSRFFETSPIVNVGLGLVWTISSVTDWDTIEYPASVPFVEQTPHNTVVRDARNWLATHPDIDWVCAPHITGAPRATQSSATSDDDSPNNPVYMFDFAGFAERQQSSVAVIGCVIGIEANEGAEGTEEIVTKLKHIGETTAAGLVVLPNRTGIHRLIDALDSGDWFETPAAPIDDTIEYYTRRPSIQAVNEELADRVPELDHVRFVTGKQLIDDIVTPVDVLPELFQERSGAE